MDNFNLKSYLQNNPLLEEFPKGKWVNLDKKEKEEFSEDIFDLISNAYAYIGGHSNYKSKEDVTGSEGDADYEVIDLDLDPDIDAVSVSKNRPAGKKFVATGHDGSKLAKRAVISHKSTDLNKPGYFIEVSGKIKDILLAKGAPMVTDEETIRKALEGRDITMNSDGSYQRKIAGEEHTKILLGKPLS